LVSHQAVPPTFYNKIAPMLTVLDETAENFWKFVSKDRFLKLKYFAL